MPAIPTVPSRATSTPPDFASSLAVAEQAFELLINGPDPLSIDGRLIGHGLPARPLPLDELRALLLHPATGLAARDVAWRILVTRARSEGPAWVVGAVGVAAPALRAASAKLQRAGVHADTQAELLAGFLTALRTVDLADERVVARLCNTAHTAARAALRAEEAARSGRVDVDLGPRRPPAPWGHPDLILARAVASGIISTRQAAVIGATRLEGISLTAYADRIRSTYEAVKRSRARGETRLADAIHSGVFDDPDSAIIREATLTFVADVSTSRE